MQQKPLPYPGIAGALRSGVVVPFLGAGVNWGARQSPKDKWWYGKREGKACTFLPTGTELSRHLAGESQFPSNDLRDLTDLPKVSSYYASSLGRDLLRDTLNNIFASEEYGPCGIHEHLAGVEVPMLIVTTNYDDLTERAFVKASRPFYVVSHLTDRDDWRASVVWWKYDPPPGGAQAGPPDIVPMAPPIHPNDLDKHIDFDRTVIYKMHGTAASRHPSWNSYVVTEDDYVEFLSRMGEKSAIPATFITRFYDKHFLFLGYGLRDWNFRVVLRDLFGSGKRRGRNSWAIQSEPTLFERSLWESRGVDIYDMDVNDFARLLASVV